MAIERVNFDSIGAGGDNPTGALVKLDANCADLDARATTNAGSASAASVAAAGALTAANAAQTDATKALLAQTINGTFRNKLINADFDVWQERIILAAGTGGYSADQWHCAAAGSTIAASRQAFVPGDTSQPPGHSDYFIRLAVVSTAGANNYAIFRQFIEGVSRFSNKVIGVSFWMRTLSGVKLGVDLGTFNVTGAGSGYLPAQVVTAANAGWNQYKLYFTTNDLTGATIAANNALLLRFTLDAGATSGAATAVGQQSIGSMDFSQVQVEVLPSLTAPHTPFESRPVSDEMPLCRRYYRKSFPQGVVPAQNAGVAGMVQVYLPAAGAVACWMTQFDTPMRVAPSITFYNPAAANGNWRNFTAGTDNAPFADPTPNDSGFGVTAAGGPAQGARMGIHYTADARF